MVPPTVTSAPPVSKVTAFVMAMSKSISWGLALLLSRLPSSSMAFPASVKLMAEALKVSPPKAVPAAKLLLGVGRFGPSKMSELPATGAPGLQFPPVVQLSSAPLPFHVGVAALAESAPPNNRVATARPQYFLVRLCFITLFGLG